MRIGVDGRSLAADAGRGVARVTLELLAAMAARYPEDQWRVLLPGGAGEVPPGATAYRTRAPGRVLFGAAALTGRPRIDALLGGVDVVWLPAPAPVAISRGVPWVLTLHDLSWLERPRDFTAYERMWHLLARPRSQALGAARVAAVSEHTRGLAIERWGLDPARVTVVRPPAARCAEPAAAAPDGGGGGAYSDGDGDPYFLWVGPLEPRKAPEVLAAAWSTARDRGLTARLIVVGEGRVPLAGAGVERRGHVTDAELWSLYAGALALVVPSWLEGAGLPPLEAALQGTPSICSDLAALRESLGPDGADWVAPGDPEALARALVRMWQDDERRGRIAASARAAAASRSDPGPPAQRLRTLLAEAASG